MTLLTQMRQEALRLFDAGVAAADPADAVRSALADMPLACPQGGRLFVIGIGKAARSMAAAALTVLPNPAQALVVTNYENEAPLEGARVMAAGHPVPDEAGIRAGQAVLDLLSRTRPDDRVLALISGGGSALLPAPRPGVTLDDKAEVSRLLLGAGLDIVTMNAVRQHLSLLKGGGLLKAAAPAPVRALILSDVIGDDLRAIASGPTAEPIMSGEEVVQLLHDNGLWLAVPETVRRVLSQQDNANDPATPIAENELIGSNRKSLEAMLAAADPWPARIICDRLIGDVGVAATRICRAFFEAPPDKPLAALFGGETTVRLTGTGRGGRNQELALRVALEIGAQGREWAFLSGGTDGRDGPTDAAGGLVDGGTQGRIARSGGDAHALLANNDSHTALDLAGDLVRTGATGTNVADLQILLLAPPYENQAAYRLANQLSEARWRV